MATYQPAWPVWIPPTHAACCCPERSSLPRQPSLPLLPCACLQQCPHAYLHTRPHLDSSSALPARIYRADPDPGSHHRRQPPLTLDYSSPSRYLRFLQGIRVHTCWVSWIWHRPDSWFCLWIPSLQTFTAKAHRDAHNTQEHEWKTAPSGGRREGKHQEAWVLRALKNKG